VAWAARRPELVWSGLGGWLTMLADPGGNYPVRARVMGTFILAGSIATFAGSFAAQSPWTAVPVLLVCALISNLVRVRGDAAAVSGVLTLIIFCIAEGTPAAARPSLIHPVLFAAGGLFALPPPIPSWP